jgi:hypothetical protein
LPLPSSHTKSPIPFAIPASQEASFAAETMTNVSVSPVAESASESTLSFPPWSCGVNE